jgi:protein ImuB
MNLVSKMQGYAASRARLSPPLWGRGGEGGITNSGVCGSPPSLTLPRKGGGNGEVFADSGMADGGSALA